MQLLLQTLRKSANSAKYKINKVKIKFKYLMRVHSEPGTMSDAGAMTMSEKG